MKYNYDNLWKLLIDKRMKKSQLQKKLGLAPATLSRMGRGEAVSMAVLHRICIELNVDIGDIVGIESLDTHKKVATSKKR